MNNPFATVAAPAAHQPTLQANPFAPQAPTPQHQPAFPTSAPTANPFAAVTQTPPPAPPVQVPLAQPTQGVAAIQAAFTFPPLNPPGEAGLGLGLSTVPSAAQGLATEQALATANAAPVPPEPAPKARRSRKPRTQNEQTALDQQALATGGPAPAYEVDAAGYSHANEDAMRYGVQPTLDSATTEELRDALNARGWNVTLVAS